MPSGAGPGGTAGSHRSRRHAMPLCRGFGRRRFRSCLQLADGHSGREDVPCSGLLQGAGASDSLAQDCDIPCHFKVGGTSSPPVAAVVLPRGIRRLAGCESNAEQSSVLPIRVRLLPASATVQEPSLTGCARSLPLTPVSQSLADACARTGRSGGGLGSGRMKTSPSVRSWYVGRRRRRRRARLTQ